VPKQVGKQLLRVHRLVARHRRHEAHELGVHVVPAARGVVWCGAVWCGVCGVAWCGVVRCGAVRCSRLQAAGASRRPRPLNLSPQLLHCLFPPSPTPFTPTHLILRPLEARRSTFLRRFSARAAPAPAPAPAAPASRSSRSSSA
jgi:hypothetical protein